MFLLTAHGTLLARHNDGLIFQIERSDDLSLAVQVDTVSDRGVVTKGHLAGFRSFVNGERVALARDGRFLCAEVDRLTAPINREFAGPWENFRLVNEQDLALAEKETNAPNAEMERFAKRVARMNAAGEPVKVYFGAGQVPIPGFLNVDIDLNAPDFAKIYPDWYFNFPYMGNRVDVPEGCIDFVFDEDLVEHVPQIVQIQYLAETRRLLKPGSCHRINTPSLLRAMKLHSDFERGAEGVYTGELRWGHMALFSHASLREIAELVGFRQVFFNGKGSSVSPHAIPDRRPGPERDQVFGNIYVDLLK